MASVPCSVPSAHRRLMDCHVHWHSAADSYMEPEAFRLNLNALVQDLRNVTWLLQRQKHELQDFDQWYPAWQDSASDDPVMQWIVSARNRVVHLADLEMHSHALVRLSRGWGDDEVEHDLKLPPRYSADQIMSVFLSSMPRSVTSGVMTVERRWVYRELPGVELLDATARAYDRLVDVVLRAHATAGIEGCDLTPRVPDCVDARLLGGLICMSQADSRRLHVDVGSQMERVEGHAVIRRSNGPAPEVLRQRYGEFKTQHGDAIARVLPATGMAKRLLAVDKNLATVAWVIRDSAVVDGLAMVFDDDTDRRVAMHRLADLVARAGADGVLILTEAWWAPPTSTATDSAGRPIPPSQRPDRGEAIWITGMTREGRIRQSLTRFSRAPNGAIHFKRPEFTDGGPVGILEPIAQRWREMDANQP
jgi:hypothetical protein